MSILMNIMTYLGHEILISKLNVRAMKVTGGVVLLSFMRGVEVKPNMDTSYYADEKESIEKKLNSLETLVTSSRPL